MVGISSRAVQDYVAKGVLTLDAQHRILKDESLLRYCEHLRHQAQGRKGESGIDLASARAELTQAQLVEQKLRNDKLRGQVLTLDEVREGWGRFAMSVRTSVLSIPSRARATIPHLTPHDGETLQNICRDVLTDAAAELADGAVAGADVEALEP